MFDKPIDRWLGLGSLAVAIALYLLPKTPFVVIACLVVIFGVLVHPVWNFWWIEESLTRRVGALVILAGLLVIMGDLAWPEVLPAPLADLRVTDWERLPIPLIVGQKAEVHLHVKNRNDAPVKAVAKYSPIWVDGNPEAMDYPARKAFEDDLWQKMLDAQKQTNDTPITIPGRMDDYWLPLKSEEPLTREQLEGLPVNKTLYFMGRIVALDGKLLMEFCAHTGPDSRTVLYCLDHNGLP